MMKPEMTMIRLRDALEIGKGEGTNLKMDHFYVPDDDLAEDRFGVTFSWGAWDIFIPYTNIIGLYHLREDYEDWKEEQEEKSCGE